MSWFGAGTGQKQSSGTVKAGHSKNRKGELAEEQGAQIHKNKGSPLQLLKERLLSMCYIEAVCIKSQEEAAF